MGRQLLRADDTRLRQIIPVLIHGGHSVFAAGLYVGRNLLGPALSDKIPDGVGGDHHLEDGYKATKLGSVNKNSFC